MKEEEEAGAAEVCARGGRGKLKQLELKFQSKPSRVRQSTAQ